MTAVLILTTAPDLGAARRIAKALVQKKLAACVSLKEGFLSFYRWKGRVERSREVVLFIKSSKTKFVPIKRLLGKIHPYEIPELIALSIHQGSPEYLAWIADSLS